MPSSQNIPAAQYLRMSTDHQQYSTANQADAIARYADAHGFQITRTFSDEARSGLSIKHRSGLKQLLKETVEGHHDFQAILVYDVSRWGRFQDTDEAAHYEFLCKQSGCPVYYCAEPFSEEQGFSAAILKSLKRTMAGEYSRELSAKVRAGQDRLAKLGYKLGGTAPYGLRRMLLSSSGTPKQLLAAGERKSLTTERVTFVPGPSNEVAVVQRIFREFTIQNRALHAIARGLNSEGIPYLGGRKWGATKVTRVLTHPAYMGMQTWGRTSTILLGPRIKIPPHRWATYDSAFEAIISPIMFRSAQFKFASFPHNLSDEQLLDRFRCVVEKYGPLTGKTILASKNCPGLTTIRNRFGGLNELYLRLGLPTRHFVSSLCRLKWQTMRNDLVNQCVKTFPNDFTIFIRGVHCRSVLKYRRTGLLISVSLAIFCPTEAGKQRWFIRQPGYERNRPAVIGFLDENNAGVARLLLFRKVPFRKTRVVADNTWLQSGIPVERMSDLLPLIKALGSGQARKG